MENVDYRGETPLFLGKQKSRDFELAKKTRCFGINRYPPNFFEGQGNVAESKLIKKSSIQIDFDVVYFDRGKKSGEKLLSGFHRSERGSTLRMRRTSSLNSFEERTPSSKYVTNPRTVPRTQSCDQGFVRDHHSALRPEGRGLVGGQISLPPFRSRQPGEGMEDHK